MVTKQDILCISTQDWNDLWTRKQRFMQRFARQGNKVLYIEAQASLISFGILKKDFARIFRWLLGPRKINNSLFIATLPLVLPFFQMSLTINRINNWIIGKILKYWIKKLGFKDPILWIYPPHSVNLIGKFREKFAIYECVDELSVSKGLVRSQTVSTLEKRLLEKVDIVIVTHENLYKSKSVFNKNIHLIPNGAEIEHFRKSSLPETPLAPKMEKISKPVIGFLGSIQYWIDLDLIAYIAISKPEWSIVLIGPIGRLAKIEKVHDLPNVYLLGKKQYKDLPSYLKAWDICINPYVMDETANNCSPLKLYEYLASGKPVVSVDMPEARKFKNFLAIGFDYKDFVQKIAQTLAQLPEEKDKISSRVKCVEKYSWTHRFQKLEKVVESYLGQPE